MAWGPTKGMKADYDSISDQWCELRKALPAKDSELFELFVSRLPPKAKILDMGCGSGIPIAKQLAEKGFTVLGIDRSANLLQAAQRNVPSGIFQKAEIEAYEVAGRFDGVVLWDSIFHIPREHHRAILIRIYDALESGGLLLLSSGGSDKEIPSFTDFMFGVEFFYDAFTPDQLIKLCKGIGFSLERATVVNKPDGISDKGRFGAVLSKT